VFGDSQQPTSSMVLMAIMNGDVALLDVSVN